MVDNFLTLSTWYGALILTIALAFFISLGLLLLYARLRKKLAPEYKDPQLEIDFDKVREVGTYTEAVKGKLQYQIELNQRAIEDCLESGIPLDDMTKEVNRLAAANNRLRHHLN